MEHSSTEAPTVPVAVTNAKVLTASRNIRLTKYFLVGSGFILIAAIVSLLLWASLNSRQALNTDNNNGTSSTTSNNQSSAESDSSNTNQSTQSSATSSTSVIIPTGWKLFSDADTGISFALPVQDSYIAKTATPSTFEQPNQWYITTGDRNTDTPGEHKSTIWGLKWFDDLKVFSLNDYPGRYDSSNFACGGLCANQNFIIVTANKGNTSTIQQMVKAVEDVVASNNAEYQAQNAEITLKIDGLKYSTRWGHQAAEFVLKYEGGLEEDIGDRYYLISTGTNAYNIFIAGVNADYLQQVLNTFTLP